MALRFVLRPHLPPTQEPPSSPHWLMGAVGTGTALAGADDGGAAALQQRPSCESRPGSLAEGSVGSRCVLSSFGAPSPST